MDWNVMASAGSDNSILIWDLTSEKGICKLLGHKSSVSCCRFFKKRFFDGNKRRLLISGSKDSLLKIWDVDGQYCVQTLVGSRGDILCFSINPTETRLVAPLSGNKLRVWSLDVSEFDSLLEVESERIDESGKDEPSFAMKMGAVTFDGKEDARISGVSFNPSGELLSVHVSGGRSIHIFECRERKRKRKREKARAPRMRLIPRSVVTAGAAISHCDWNPNPSESPSILLSLSNNRIESHKIPKQPESPSKPLTISQSGHSTSIRHVAISSTSNTIASSSAGCLKLWSVSTRKCTATIPCGYALASCFVPKDRHVLIGTKTGSIELFDTVSATLVDTVAGHKGAIWSITLSPSQKGFVTASADKSVKFWDFKLTSSDEGHQELGFSLSQTITMSDDVLCVKFSPDGRFIATALLDSTVKVLHSDSLKFCFSLYGHKLPVMNLDISFDSDLIVTASADKNVKIWGLDFGDCHKSLFAHNDTVTQVLFVPKTHYFFSCSKDREIKYWDADKFELIDILTGHCGAVWGMAITRDGGLLVSCGDDRSLRLWERTEEQVFPKSEKDMRMEASALSEAVEKKQKRQTTDELHGKTTIACVDAADSLMEFIQLAHEHLFANTEIDPIEIEPSPLFLGKSPSQFLLSHIRSISTPQLEQVLSLLPLHVVLQFLPFLERWMRFNQSTELVSRLLFSLVRIHGTSFASNPAALELVASLSHHTRKNLQKERDLVGFNLSAMKHLKRTVERNSSVKFFAPSLREMTRKRKRDI